MNSHHQPWRGVFAIPVTPFDDQGQLDRTSLERLVDFCVESGASGLVAPVNASEFSTLADDERDQVVNTLVTRAAGRIPVVIGVSAGSPQWAAALARRAEQAGADAVMAMPPVVRTAREEEIIEHFGIIAHAISVPIFVQNYPEPVGTPMSPACLVKIAREVSQVQYIKEEVSPSVHRISEVLASVGQDLQGIMGGVAGRFMIPEFHRGACGVMPACEVVDVHAAVWAALENGEESHARDIFMKLLPLLNYESAFGTSLYKEVLRRRGVIRSSYRRIPRGPALDAHDQAEVDILLRALSEHFRGFHP